MSEALVRRFYDGLAALDSAGIVGCYHRQASFTDPVFPDLRADQVPARWKMLLRGITQGAGAGAPAGDSLALTYRIVRGDDRKAVVTWEARYRLAGRVVHNRIESSLTFWDELIVRQVDEFSFWRWSRQALGPPAWVAGWLPPYQRAVQQQAARRLRDFMNAG